MRILFLLFLLTAVAARPQGEYETSDSTSTTTQQDDTQAPLDNSEPATKVYGEANVEKAQEELAAPSLETDGGPPNYIRPSQSPAPPTAQNEDPMASFGRDGTAAKAEDHSYDSPSVPSILELTTPNSPTEMKDADTSESSTDSTSIGHSEVTDAVSNSLEIASTPESTEKVLTTNEPEGSGAQASIQGNEDEGSGTSDNFENPKEGSGEVEASGEASTTEPQTYENTQKEPNAEPTKQAPAQIQDEPSPTTEEMETLKVETVVETKGEKPMNSVKADVEVATEIDNGSVVSGASTGETQAEVDITEASGSMPSEGTVDIESSTELLSISPEEVSSISPPPLDNSYVSLPGSVAPPAPPTSGELHKATLTPYSSSQESNSEEGSGSNEITAVSVSSSSVESSGSEERELNVGESSSTEVEGSGDRYVQPDETSTVEPGLIDTTTVAVETIILDETTTPSNSETSSMLVENSIAADSDVGKEGSGMTVAGTMEAEQQSYDQATETLSSTAASIPNEKASNYADPTDLQGALTNTVVSKERLEDASNIDTASINRISDDKETKRKVVLKISSTVGNSSGIDSDHVEGEVVVAKGMPTNTAEISATVSSPPGSARRVQLITASTVIPRMLRRGYRKLRRGHMVQMRPRGTRVVAEIASTPTTVTRKISRARISKKLKTVEEQRRDLPNSERAAISDDTKLTIKKPTESKDQTTFGKNNDQTTMSPDQTTTTVWMYVTAPGERTAGPEPLAPEASLRLNNKAQSEEKQQTTTDIAPQAPTSQGSGETTRYDGGSNDILADSPEKGSSSQLVSDVKNVVKTKNGRQSEVKVQSTLTGDDTQEATVSPMHKWMPYKFDCENEIDDKGLLCQEWADGGLCLEHRPTMFLFCRKTCLCTGPSTTLQ